MKKYVTWALALSFVLGSLGFATVSKAADEAATTAATTTKHHHHYYHHHSHRHYHSSKKAEKPVSETSGVTK